MRLLLCKDLVPFLLLYLSNEFPRREAGFPEKNGPDRLTGSFVWVCGGGGGGGGGGGVCVGGGGGGGGVDAKCVLDFIGSARGQKERYGTSSSNCKKLSTARI